MRLICPNCDAQYEVPPEVIPPEGRDVQCSNCGQTWYQNHPDHANDTSASADDALEDEEYAASGDDDDAEDFADDDAEDDEYDDDEDDPEDREQRLRDDWEDAGRGLENEAFGARDDDTGPRRRELDPSIAEVLRAEAEREAQARRAEGLAGVESQPELGLADTPEDVKRRSQEARARMARLRGERDPDDDDDDFPAASASVMGSRRDLLPDIEEINSTLRSNSDRSPGSDPGQTAQIETQEKRNSWMGFSLTVALFALLALVYAFAADLSGIVPQAAPVLDGYVAMIDGWRGWLDGQFESLLSWLDAAAVSSTQ